MFVATNLKGERAPRDWLQGTGSAKRCLSLLLHEEAEPVPQAKRSRRQAAHATIAQEESFPV